MKKIKKVLTGILTFIILYLVVFIGVAIISSILMALSILFTWETIVSKVILESLLTFYAFKVINGLGLLIGTFGFVMELMEEDEENDSIGWY